MWVLWRSTAVSSKLLSRYKLGLIVVTRHFRGVVQPFQKGIGIMYHVSCIIHIIAYVYTCFLSQTRNVETRTFPRPKDPWSPPLEARIAFETELFSPRPLSANVSPVKPDRGDNHHSSAISSKSRGGA